MLAHLEPNIRDRLLRSRKLIARTPRTITGVADFEAELEKVREQGYGISDQENFEGIISVAVPVRDEKDRVVAALTMHGPLPRLSMESCMASLPRLNAAADQISRSWGLV